MRLSPPAPLLHGAPALGPIYGAAWPAAVRRPAASMTFSGAISAEGLNYWDLHGLLFIPTLWLLTLGTPRLLDPHGDALAREACIDFILFILCIAVAQAFVWDSIGARIGIWQFNPAKCTDFGDGSVLPIEEVAWLFHHVVKAALWQLKVFELPWTAANTRAIGPLPAGLRWAITAALVGVTLWGGRVLGSSEDELKCVALVAAFFSPVFTIIFNLGSRYWRSHWRLVLFGWLPPGLWTVAIDCLGQQQNVWYFPPSYLTGIAWSPGVPVLDGWLKLDIAAVYLVSTLAVTATGAIILATTEEFAAARADRASGRPLDPDLYCPPSGVEASLLDLGLFLFGGAFSGLPQRWLPAAVGARDAQYDSTAADSIGPTDASMLNGSVRGAANELPSGLASQSRETSSSN